MYRMADTMADYGFETLAVLPSDEGIAQWYRDSDVDYEVMESPPLRRRRSPLEHLWYLLTSLLTLLQIVLLLRRRNADILHVNEIRYPVALVAGRLAGVKVVCHVRSPLGSYTVRWALSLWATTLAHHVVCVSDQTRKLVFEETGHDGATVEVVHDCLPYKPETARTGDGLDLRDEVGVPEDTFLAINISKLVKSKGQDRVLRALDHVNDDMDVHVAIVGGSVTDHEAYEKFIENRAKANPKATMVGFVENALNVIEQSDALIHVPRNEDPFPNVVLEGLMSGIPVLATKTGGIPEQVRDGKTGVLLNEEDTERDLATAITRLASNPEERESMEDEVIRDSEERFSVEQFRRHLESIYE
jgi:glycosyltransferase involved in cell wall biosynthesis